MKSLFIFFVYLGLQSCGTLTETESTSGNCRDYIEDELWQDAIDCYENGEYTESPAQDLDADEYLYLAQWAAAYGAKYGLVGSAIIDGVLGEGSDSGLPIDISGIVTSLVDSGGLAQGITDIEKAMALISAFPSDLRDQNGDNAVYYAGDLSLLGLLFTTFSLNYRKRILKFHWRQENSLRSNSLKKQMLSLMLQNGGEVIGDPDLASVINEQLGDHQFTTRCR